MEFWQTAVALLSFWALTGVGACVARRNWSRLNHGIMADGGSTPLMVDEWHLSNEARAAIRQAFWLVVGLFLAGEGLVFSAVSIYTFLFA